MGPLSVMSGADHEENAQVLHRQLAKARKMKKDACCFRQTVQERQRGKPPRFLASALSPLAVLALCLLAQSPNDQVHIINGCILECNVPVALRKCSTDVPLESSRICRRFQ